MRVFRRLGFIVPVVLCVVARGFAGQSDREPRGFGEIELGAPVSTIPFPCNRPVLCEAPNEADWVRIWHDDRLIGRVDVIYTGKAMDLDVTIQSSAITLVQAIRSHSIRHGQKSPRLGYAGDEAGLRIIVDTANAIAYVAEGMYTGSLVKEVRYLPETDAVVAAACLSPLTEHGKWLVKAAWAAPRYKNLRASPETMVTELVAREESMVTRKELAARLQQVSSQEKSFAAATLMLSERLSESLRGKQEPNAEIAANLRKAYALLSATETEATALLKDYGVTVTPGDILALRPELAERADARMHELQQEGILQ